MANFRKYKNGMYGLRRKGYFIIPSPSGKRSYSVSDGDGNIVLSGLKALYDAEWEIDKLAATQAELEVAREIYSHDLYSIENFFRCLYDKKSQGTADSEDLKLLEWVSAVRSRRTKNRPF